MTARPVIPARPAGPQHNVTLLTSSLPLVTILTTGHYFLPPVLTRLRPAFDQLWTIYLTFSFYQYLTIFWAAGGLLAERVRYERVRFLTRSGRRATGSRGTGGWSTTGGPWPTRGLLTTFDHFLTTFDRPRIPRERDRGGGSANAFRLRSYHQVHLKTEAESGGFLG